MTELRPRPTVDGGADLRDLTGTVIDDPDAGRPDREGEQPERSHDEPLPTQGGDALGFREVIRAGGAQTLAVLFALNLVDEFDRVALAVLAPDIQASLGVSDTVLAVLATLGGLLIVLGAVPIGYLADRSRRTHVIAGVSAILGLGMVLTGLVKQAWHLAFTRMATGFGKGGGPAFNSVLADAYPIAGRGRVFGTYNLASPLGLLVAPVLAGGVAALAGGDEGWRWAFIVLAIPTLVLAAVAIMLPDPPRGRNEQLAVFGTDAVDLGSEPAPIGVAFARLRKVRTFYFLLVGLGITGFGLFSFPVFFNLFLEDHYGLDAFERGVVVSLAAAGGLVGALAGGVIADRTFRRSPPRAVVATAVLLGLFTFSPIALYAPGLGLLVLVAAIGQAGLQGTIAGLTAIVASVIPYRLRAQGYALVAIYIFFLGGFLGAIITGQLSDAFGPRTALSIVIPPSLLVGAAVMAYGARFIREDMALIVEELQEERVEAQRVAAGGDVPVLQVHNLDVSYGPVQVLFDVDLEVWPGEVLALLGTNGAGKSTLLRAVSGLSVPDRGVIRLNGRGVTYADAETRVRAGIVQVPGGKAVFPSLTVRENLEVGAHTFNWDRPRVDAACARVLELFPDLADRVDQRAGTLSGGQQQMLALAKGMLLEPEILLLDELSLGLAPIVVEEILTTVERLKARGVTMVIVEQSVNVALAIADRAVFMEKGQIRFEGPAADLLARDDLLRAVFLGGAQQG